MIIKKREVLFSAIIVLVMLLVGLFVSDAILQSAISKSEDYRTATVIENEDQFLYGMQTNFGHSLVYGEVSSDSSVHMMKLKAVLSTLKSTRSTTPGIQEQ